ncbi:hypothetical protein ISN44_Un109g000090 [Arabidopsis suecica]|uniref:Uncharacterized protein n=1 Tax=Arabidopsis suecica TaxID=45249 RepID=A0A8T1XGN3_ARASU|nr:hypothetical protein ISN44_Un109g000090 [Arabidopsis suecica]
MKSGGLGGGDEYLSRLRGGSRSNGAVGDVTLVPELSAVNSTRKSALIRNSGSACVGYASRTSSASLNRYVKRLVDNGISSDEAKLLTRDISAIMLRKAKKEKAQRVDIAEYIRIITPGQTTKKLLDPGSFVLDCSISISRFSCPLCDLGSSINLMPKSVTERLGMTHYKPTRITLLFADRSKRIPKGILKDVPVQVGNSVIPADFVVLDYEKEPKDPLILGRAFLAIADARFDVKRRRISLKICDLEMEFGMDGSELTKPISCIASTTDTPPQTAHNPTTEPHTTLLFAQLANESCRATVSIDTPTPVDRHPRISLTDDSAHSLQPTPPEDLCDKFSSLCSPALSLINSLDYSKTASQDNKPRLLQPDPFTHSLGRRGGSSNPPPLHPHPELRQVKVLTQNKRLVGGNPQVRVNPTIGKSRFQTNRLEDILVSNTTTKARANLTTLPFTSSNG